MDLETYKEFAELAVTGSGQHIPWERSYIIEARLSSIIRREGFSSARELADCLQSRPNPVLKAEIVAALTAKNTRFFRERDSLEYIIDEVLPRQKEAGAKRLRVLCAGGSTGQEAYSLAMLLAEAPDTLLGDVSVEILSLDICNASTERARSGHYGHFEVQRGLSISRLLKHFTRQEDGGWKISDDMRLMVGFRTQNLCEPIDGLGTFDAVLCRDVFSGMAKPISKYVAEKLTRQVIPGGVFITGENEKIPFLTDDFAANEELRHVYQRSRTAAAAAA